MGHFLYQRQNSILNWPENHTALTWFIHHKGSVMSSLTPHWASHMLLEFTVTTKPKPNHITKTIYQEAQTPCPPPHYQDTQNKTFASNSFSRRRQCIGREEASTSLFSHLPERFHLLLSWSCSNLRKINHPKALKIPWRPQQASYMARHHSLLGG